MLYSNTTLHINCETLNYCEIQSLLLKGFDYYIEGPTLYTAWCSLARSLVWLL